MPSRRLAERPPSRSTCRGRRIGATPLAPAAPGARGLPQRARSPYGSARSGKSRAGRGSRRRRRRGGGIWEAPEVVSGEPTVAVDQGVRGPERRSSGTRAMQISQGSARSARNVSLDERKANRQENLKSEMGTEALIPAAGAGESQGPGLRGARLETGKPRTVALHFLWLGFLPSHCSAQQWTQIRVGGAGNRNQA